jgi:hypothetical protein
MYQQLLQTKTKLHVQKVPWDRRAVVQVQSDMKGAILTLTLVDAIAKLRGIEEEVCRVFQMQRSTPSTVESRYRWYEVVICRPAQCWAGLDVLLLRL